MRITTNREESLRNLIKVGDYITTARYQRKMRVIKCYRGAWSLKPMLDCQDSPNCVAISIYVEDVINHFPKRF